ncbi:unnamed protein product [Allacma fusca]|uniref:Uncharacterized protein n=1 Tax=Allacma fusca TaxID=39272 RepID=A0A8J2NIJ3_9HEXA|nr:unnamed protein product [Allacma fusca]
MWFARGSGQPSIYLFPTGLGGLKIYDAQGPDFTLKLYSLARPVYFIHTTGGKNQFSSLFCSNPCNGPVKQGFIEENRINIEHVRGSSLS